MESQFHYSNPSPRAPRVRYSRGDSASTGKNEPTEQSWAAHRDHSVRYPSTVLLLQPSSLSIRRTPGPFCHRPLSLCSPVCSGYSQGFLLALALPESSQSPSMSTELHEDACSRDGIPERDAGNEDAPCSEARTRGTNLTPSCGDTKAKSKVSCSPTTIPMRRSRQHLEATPQVTRKQSFNQPSYFFI